MGIEIFHDIVQGSDEWGKIRLGVPTASCFGKILSNGRGGEASKTRRRYMLELAGEIITGMPMESYTNAHMERGKALEPEARNLYSLMFDADPQLVGFIRNGNRGCSPDSLIGDDGMLEIKTQLPALLIDTLLRNEFPPEHKAQTQGALLVAEREWIDLLVYWPKIPLFAMRAFRDEKYISSLSSAIDEFNEELVQLVEQVRART